MSRARQPELPVVLLEGIAALLGLVFALTGVGLTILTGNPMWDAIGTLAIGVLLVLVAIVLGIETKSLLLSKGRNELLLRGRPPADTTCEQEATPHRVGTSDTHVTTVAEFCSELQD